MSNFQGGHQIDYNGLFEHHGKIINEFEDTTRARDMDCRHFFDVVLLGTLPNKSPTLPLLGGYTEVWRTVVEFLGFKHRPLNPGHVILSPRLAHDMATCAEIEYDNSQEDEWEYLHQEHTCGQAVRSIWNEQHERSFAELFVHHYTPATRHANANASPNADKLWLENRPTDRSFFFRFIDGFEFIVQSIAQVPVHVPPSPVLSAPRLNVRGGEVHRPPSPARAAPKGRAPHPRTYAEAVATILVFSKVRCMCDDETFPDRASLVSLPRDEEENEVEDEIVKDFVAAHYLIKRPTESSYSGLRYDVLPLDPARWFDDRSALGNSPP